MQGLGKTISTIALILKERSPPYSNIFSLETKEEISKSQDDDDEEDEDDEAVNKLSKSNQRTKNSIEPARIRAGTLVVCPTSVIRQWNDELHNKVSAKSRLSVLLYHGKNRTKDPLALAKYDVVLTTYAIVSMEVPHQRLTDEIFDETKKHDEFHPSDISSTKKRKHSNKGKKEIENQLYEPFHQALAKVKWFRVVLDEAQSIKNHKTQVARAFWGLKGKRRWCLSGTPIHDAIDDLYSYFRFLRYDPYDVYTSFRSTIKAPIQKNPVNGYKKLQAVLQTIMLRRTKGTNLRRLSFTFIISF